MKLIKENIRTKIRALVEFTGLGSRIFRNGGAMVVMSLSSTLLSFLTTMLLARIMGASGYGVFSFYSDLFLILVIPSQFGLPALLVRETAKELEIANEAGMKALWAFAWRVNLSFSLLLSFLILIFYYFSSSTPFAATILWGLLLVPLLSILGIVSAVLRGVHKVISGKLAELVIIPAAFLLLVGLYALFSKDKIEPNSAFTMQVITTILALLITIVLLVKAVHPNTVVVPLPKISAQRYRSVWWFFWMDFLFTLMSRAPILLVGFVLSVDEVGVFKIALQMAGLAEFGLRVLRTILSPEIARLSVANDVQVLQKMATTTTRIILLLNLMVIGTFFFFGRQFIQAAFGSEFSSAYELLMILLVGQLVNSFTGAAETFLNMTGSERETVKIRMLSLAVMVALILILSPRIGAVGAAIGLSVAMVLWNALLWAKLWRSNHINTLPFRISKSAI